MFKLDKCVIKNSAFFLQYFKKGNSNSSCRQVGVLLKKDGEVGALACGFHHLKHLSGLSHICTLAKYGFNFKKYLSHIYQGQI